MRSLGKRASNSNKMRLLYKLNIALNDRNIFNAAAVVKLNNKTRLYFPHSHPMRK